MSMPGLTPNGQEHVKEALRIVESGREPEMLAAHAMVNAMTAICEELAEIRRVLENVERRVAHSGE